MDSNAQCQGPTCQTYTVSLYVKQVEKPQKNDMCDIDQIPMIITIR